MRLFPSILSFLLLLVPLYFASYFFEQQAIEQIASFSTGNFSSLFTNCSLFTFDINLASIFFRKIFELGKKETKVFKDSRYNFASLLGGAKILEKNSDCLYDKSVLDDNPDKFPL